MALGDPYATLAELKQRLGIDTSDTTEDTVLTAVLASATAAVNSFCDRQFNDAGTTSAREYRPATCDHVDVDDFSTTTGLIVAVDTGGDGTYATTLTASDYLTEPLNGIVNGQPGWPYSEIVHLTGRWPTPRTKRPTVRVTARWGWTAVPAPVKQATLIMAHETARQKEAPGGIGGFSDFGIIRVRDNPFAARLLMPYDRHPVMVA